MQHKYKTVTIKGIVFADKVKQSEQKDICKKLGAFTKLSLTVCRLETLATYMNVSKEQVHKFIADGWLNAIREYKQYYVILSNECMSYIKYNEKVRKN